MLQENAFIGHESHDPLPQARELNALIQTRSGAEDILSKLEASPRSAGEKKRLRDYALAVIRSEEARSQEVDVRRDGYSLRLMPGAASEFPSAFIEGAYAYALEHGEILKHAQTDDRGASAVNEIVWKFPGMDGKDFVLKLIQTEKMPEPDHELRILQRAEIMGLPAPKPLGIMDVNGDPYLMMSYVSGRSGQDIWEKLPDEGWSPDEIEVAQQEVERQMQVLAERFRTKMFIDKPWYIKDCLLTFDGHRVTSVYPLDWERAGPYDPAKPKKLRSIPPVRH